MLHWPWKIWPCPTLAAAAGMLALLLMRELASPLMGPEDTSLAELAPHSGELTPHINTDMGQLILTVWVQVSWL